MPIPSTVIQIVIVRHLLFFQHHIMRGTVDANHEEEDDVLVMKMTSTKGNGKQLVICAPFW